MASILPSRPDMRLEKEPAGSAAFERGWRAALAYVLAARVPPPDGADRGRRGHRPHDRQPARRDRAWRRHRDHLDQGPRARGALQWSADPRMASLVDADPTLDRHCARRLADRSVGELVFNVVGQQLSVAATRAILARLRRYTTGVCRLRRSCLRRDTETCGASAFLVRRPCTCAISLNA